MSLRQHLTPLAVLAAMTLAGSGCQSCSHSMDYSPPVANCQCGTCGVGQRAGSATGYGGYGTDGGYVEEQGSSAPGFCPNCNRPQ